MDFIKTMKKYQKHYKRSTISIIKLVIFAYLDLKPSTISAIGRVIDHLVLLEWVQRVLPINIELPGLKTLINTINMSTNWKTIKILIIYCKFMKK